MKSWLNPKLSRSDGAACLLSGFMLALAFPPWDQSYLIWVALVPLLSRFPLETKRQHAWAGFLTGLAFYTPLLYWLGHVTVAGTVLLILYHSLILGALALLYKWLPLKEYRLAAWALVWVLVETLRALGPFSFAWGYMGHALYDWKMLAGACVPYFGVPGLSLIILLVNVLIARAYRMIRSRPYAWREEGIALGMLGGYGLLLVLLNLAAPSPPAATKEVRVALIQGNFKEGEKEVTSPSDAVNAYLDLSTRSLADHPDLIVWPESAVTVPINYSPELVALIREFVNTHNVELLLGTVYGEYLGPSKWNFQNRAILFSPGQTLDMDAYPIPMASLPHYDKIHLVPYGEWVPLGEVWPFHFIETLIEEAGAGIFERGTELTVFQLRNGARFGVAICFESTLARQLHTLRKRGADFLVNITNDAWFKRSPGLEQHFLQNVFRAMENRCYVIRAANTGITGIIAPDGTIERRIPDNEAGICTGTIYVPQGEEQ